MVNGRKYAKRAKKAVKGRYFKGGKYRKPNVYRMAKDISLLRGMLNSEKKQYTVSTTDNSYQVGQMNANNSGHWISGFTPHIPQGTTSSQRIGKQVKMTSFHIDLQLIAQSSAVTAQQFIFEIWDVIGQAQDSLSDFMGDVFTKNPFVTNNYTNVYDATSNRNVANFKNYKCVYRKRLYLPAEDLATQTSCRTFQLGKKFGKKGHMITWATDGQTIESGQQVMTIRAASGNCSPSTDSTSGGIPIAGANTGAYLKYQASYYYIDN